MGIKAQSLLRGYMMITNKVLETVLLRAGVTCKYITIAICIHTYGIVSYIMI